MIGKRTWALAAILALCGMIFLPSCSDDNPSAKEGEPYTGTPLVIFDTDIGSSTDDLFALEMLYRYEEEGRCKLLGVVVDREGEDCAAVADVMNTYFGHADVPIGLVRKGISNPPVWIDYKALLSTANCWQLNPTTRLAFAPLASLQHWPICSLRRLTTSHRSAAWNL